jgi:hypothetical protein
MKQRFYVEKEQYRTALSTNTPFKKQFQTWSDGRLLIYWQWAEQRQEDGIGIIFDPQDRLNLETERGCFRRACVGPDFISERIEKHWYMVVHRQNATPSKSQ